MTNFLQVTGFNPLIVSEPQGPQGPQGQPGPVGPTGPAGGVNSVDGKQGDVSLSNSYVLVPAASTEHYYVQPIAGNDANNGLSWGKAFATIAAAVTALGANAGVIHLAPGTHTINAPDAHGNGVTLSNQGQYLQGSGRLATVVHVTANVTWAVQLQGGYSGVSDLQVTIATGVTVSYGIGASTPTASGSLHFARFANCDVTNSGTLTAFYALGPDWPGAATVDLASCVFDHCGHAGVSNTGSQHGFLLGNGTSGNVLLNSLIECGGYGCVNGVTLAGADARIYGGGFSNTSGADINVTHPGGGPLVAVGLRCEGGSGMFYSCGYIGSMPGVTLVGCYAGSYTSASGIIVQHNGYGPLTMLGGYYDAGGSTAVAVNSFSGAHVIPLTAVGVTLANTSPSAGWPPYSATTRQRIILNASYNNAGFYDASPNFAAVIDGTASIGGTTGTTSPAAGAAGALPATPAGYLTVNIDGAAHQIPYY